MTVLTLDVANLIVAEVRKHARTIDAKPLCIAILDNRGVIVTIQTEDGSPLLRPQVAHGKAWSNLGMGISTRKMQAAYQEMPQMNAAFNSFMTLADGKLIPAPGGVFIMDGDEMIGAIGVSGDQSDIDEACAIAGIEAVGLVAKI